MLFRSDPGFSPLSKNQILSEKEYRDMREKYEDDFDAGMGAEAVKKLLQQIDLDQLSEQLRKELKDASGQKKVKIIKRLEVVDAFRVSGNKPEWMIISVRLEDTTRCVIGVALLLGNLMKRLRLSLFQVSRLESIE